MRFYRMATIGPVFLLCLLGVTFRLGLKRSQNSQRDIMLPWTTALARASRSRVFTDPESSGRSSIGSRDTAGTAAELEHPRLRMRRFPCPASSRQRAPIIPEEMLEEQDGNESDAEKVRGGLEPGGQGSGGGQRVYVYVDPFPELCMIGLCWVDD